MKWQVLCEEEEDVDGSRTYTPCLILGRRIAETSDDDERRDVDRSSIGRLARIAQCRANSGKN
jgi:hypothetical protein